MADRDPPPGATLTFDDGAAQQPTALAETLAHETGQGGAAELLAAGTVVGRYRIERVVGSGGMGVVYAARDPDLDRTIALKLLRAERTGSQGTGGQARLLREAQAMARLSHPNVIAVHDVGKFHDQVFVAMELVAGGTLRAWLQQRPARRDVVRVFAAAGRGLAAAHAAGMVHRDFKPDNVLVGDDGRVRVTDFGLARPVGAEHVTGSPPTAAATDITVTGSVIGTPRYMSPEQHLGQRLDARSDQFAFCIALYEALYGARAFDGDSLPELAAAVTSGRRAPVPASADVPRWLRDVVDRGLRVDPAERFASMDDLLDALGRDPAVRRRWIAGGVGVAGVVAGALAFAFMRGGGPELCRDAAARLGDAWTADRAGAVRAAFDADGRPHAADSASRVIARLDAYAAEWRAMYQEACEATRIRGDQSDELLDLRMQCLRERRLELAAFAGALADAPSPELVDNSVVAAYELPPIASCADADALRVAVPLPADPELRARIDALRAELAELAELRREGRYKEGAERADALIAKAVELGYGPLHAQVLFVAADLWGYAGDYARTEQLLHEAIRVGSAARDDDLVARAWIDLIEYAGAEDLRLEDADRWMPAAEAAVARAGDDDVLRSKLLQGRARIAHQRGELATARGLWEQALALTERARGPDHPDTAQILNNLGSEHGAEGNIAEAIPPLERSLAIREKVFGPNHPDVAESLFNLATAVALSGDNERSLALLERALAIREPLFGAEHQVIADNVYNMGIIQKRLGRYEDAQASLERAMRLREKLLGPDHPETGRVYDGLGNLADERGDGEAALVYYDKAMAVFEKRLPPGHPQIAFTNINAGSVLEGLGRCEEALVRFTKARDMLEAALGADSPYVAYALTGIGVCEIALGRPRRAIAPLTRGLALREASNDFEPTLLAESQFALARALWDAGADRRRAVELVRAARDRYAGADASEELAEVDAWLTRVAP